MVKSSLMKRLFFFILLMGFLPPALAGDFQKCALDQYKAYSKAQEKWQHEITGIIKKAKPELGEVAELYMNDQLVLIEKNRITVEQLLKDKPDRVQTSFPPNRWIQLGAEDINFLKQSSKRYVEFSKKAEEAEKRAPHPDGEALRLAMRTEIMKSQEFQKSFSRFMKSVSEIESRVCPTE